MATSVWSKFLVLALALLCSGALGGSPKNTVVPSWGDYVVAFGPGTDPAMDSPEAVRNMIRHWQGRGYTGIYLRTDLVQLDPSMIRRNPVVQPNPRLALLWKNIDDVMASFDAHRVGQQFAEPLGFEFWAWHPHLYSDGAPEQAGEPGPGRMVPWSYGGAYAYQHPETVTIDRKGNKLWMAPEYAYPGARAAKIAEFVHIAKNSGVKRFLACMRSEVLQLQDAPYKADQYGFNEPVVREMARRYGVDILTDPRFDVDREDFDLHDPMVENWRNLRGQYVTQLYRELRQALRGVDPQIRLAVTLSGDHVGPPLGNWRLDWRTWVDEGLVDEIISPVTFEATLDHEAGKKGYLTNVLAGVGTVPYPTLRSYIDQSRHPEIKIIATGAYPYFFKAPPAGADGWRSDVWYDAFHMAWHQRWRQWAKDLSEFGHIKFLAQDFDAVELPEHGRLEAWGCPAYDPKLRSCPGCWYPLGRGRDSRPVAQQGAGRGASGRGIKLTSAPGVDASFNSGVSTSSSTSWGLASAPGASLTAWHNSSPDRSLPTTCIDNAITNGCCTLDFWIRRASAESGLSVFLLGEERDVALRVAPGTGALSHQDRGTWVASDLVLRVGGWQRLAIRVDLDRGCYSAFLGESDEKAVCRDVKYGMPKARHVVQAGVNKPIPVPAYKMFDSVQFVPEGAAGAATYLDDVSVRWTPVLHFVPVGREVLLACDFESHPLGDRFVPPDDAKDGGWRLCESRPESYYVASGTSFGEGIKSLHARGGVAIMAAGPKGMAIREDSTITADCDVFLRSSQTFPFMIPNPLARSDHQTTLSLVHQPRGALVASVQAGEGTWRYWAGDRYVDSGVKIAYDVWSRIQMAVDTRTGACKVVVQPVGELPTAVGSGRWSEGIGVGDPFCFSISPSGAAGHISCYDNIVIANRRRDR